MGQVSTPDSFIKDMRQLRREFDRLKRTAGHTSLEVNTAGSALPTPVNGKWLFATGGAAVWSDLPTTSTVTAGITKKGVASSVAELDAGALVPVAQLGTGTPTGTKFLRDDRVFAVPASTPYSDIGGTYITDPLTGLQSGTIGSGNRGVFRRLTMAQAGTLSQIAVWITGTASGNYDFGVADVGAASSGNDRFLASKGSTAVPAGTNTWLTWNPALTVVAGQLLDFWFALSNNTCTFAQQAAPLNVAMQLVPDNSYDLAGVGMTARFTGGKNTSLPFGSGPSSDIADGNIGNGGNVVPFFLWRIT